MLDFLVQPDIEQYCYAMSSHESDILHSLAQATREQTRYPDNMSGSLVGQTLKLLASVSGSKMVLEIGMFTGYAALSMAEGLPDDGIVYCCETNPRVIELGKAFFEQSPHGHKIHVLFGNAKDMIPTINCPLDMVFIDADKKAYPFYLEMVLPMLKKGGLIVIDDALWKGNVLAPKQDRDIIMAGLNRYIAERDDLDNVLLPVRHGINIIRKK
ncbi:putative O-methyltransferase [invertebrate metagenome]|uniref:Putative O-methyltransferase n=1 Tax=invertebrate metagenome TaxID=1711999 RepID=A0A2H9TAJ9_9ZZZZ